MCQTCTTVFIYVQADNIDIDNYIHNRLKKKSEIIRTCTDICQSILTSCLDICFAYSLKSGNRDVIFSANVHIIFTDNLQT